VRNLLIRQDYRPAGSLAASGREDWNEFLNHGTATAEDVLRRYTVRSTSRPAIISRRPRAGSTWIAGP